MKLKRSYGFTLVELLIVIAIIGILVTIVIIAINPVTVIQKSQDARRRSDLQALRTSMQLYYNDYKVYPEHYSSGEPRCGASTSGAAGYLNLNTGFGTANTWATDGASSCNGAGDTVYMKAIPTDPINSGGYQYYYQSQATLQAYRIVTNLAFPNAAETAATVTNKCGAIGSSTGGAPDTSPYTVATDGAFQNDYAVCND